MVQQLRHSHRHLCSLSATPEYQSGARRRIVVGILGWLLKLLLLVGKNTGEDVGCLLYLAAGSFHIPNKIVPGARTKHKFGKSPHNQDGYSYVFWDMQTAVKMARLVFALLQHKVKGWNKIIGRRVYVNIIKEENWGARQITVAQKNSALKTQTSKIKVDACLAHSQQLHIHELLWYHFPKIMAL